MGVVVHHVASVYPVEVELAQVLGSGSPITGVTMEVINTMNAEHARNNATISKEETLELLEKNSKAAAETLNAYFFYYLFMPFPVYRHFIHLNSFLK